MALVDIIAPAISPGAMLAYSMSAAEARFITAAPWLFSADTVRAAQTLLNPDIAYSPMAQPAAPAAIPAAYSSRPMPVSVDEAARQTSQSIADAAKKTQAQTQQYFADTAAAIEAAGQATADNTWLWIAAGVGAASIFAIVMRKK